jgi:hypothetical protein
MRSLTSYLYKYYQIQDDISLIYHPSPDSFWNDRCKFLGEGYQPHKPYNHRKVLDYEVVIEYDFDDPQKNLEMIREIESRYKKNNISYSLWHSGNKSYHLHCFINVTDVTKIRQLKRNWIFHYTAGLVNPDMQLCGKVFIRSEYGIHEKTRRKKTLIRESKDYPLLNPIPDTITERLEEQQEVEFIDNSELMHTEAIKLLQNTERFKTYNDGRERAMFILIHLLKEKQDKSVVTEWLQHWYESVGGHKLNRKQIANKVEDHWNRTYHLGGFINDLMYDLGLENYKINFIKE